MSKRNSQEEKKKRRLLKLLRATPEPNIDLIAYVRDRTGCSRGTAERVLLAGALMVDSHPIGFKWQRSTKVLDPYVPAEYRDRIIVRMPKELQKAENE